MLRLIVILTVLLTTAGLSQFLQPLLMSGPPRLVKFDTGEKPYVINLRAPKELQVSDKIAHQAKSAPEPELTSAVRSWAELVMRQRS